MKNIKISEIMSTHLITVDINQKTEDVKRLFEHHHIHHIPVLDKGKLCGIISLTDFLRITLGAELVEQGEAFDNEGINKVILEYVTVEQLMTQNPVSLGPDALITDAIRLFRLNIFHAIPVVEKGKLIGLVSSLDLLTYMEKILNKADFPETALISSGGLC